MMTLETTIRKYYSELHRVYHTYGHIERIFADADKERINLSAAQKLAIYFHDIVYVPGAKDNEQNSAQLLTALNGIAGGLFDLYSEQDIVLAKQIIIETMDHIALTPEAEVVIDLDLCGLGDELESYLAAGDRVRSEFAYCSDDMWVVGRKAFLTRFLSRDKIFYTEKFQKYENQARFNLQHELNIL